MIPEDLVYLVSIVNVDSCSHRYICDTEEKALEVFEELRNECIADCEEAIQYYCEDNHTLYLVSHEQEKIAFLKAMQPKDTPPWCCDRPTIEVFPFLRSQHGVPSSKELISLAENDWHNREERKHKHPMSPWVSGWISGFLTPSKPGWNKEREEKVRKGERNNLVKDMIAAIPNEGMSVWEERGYLKFIDSFRVEE
jgi:hypothetical protein